MSTHTSTNPNMVDDLLFEQFATLATAPDGIGRLRALILQLAVQGRLGTQDAGDEPAGKLVERVREEKEQLVKKGRIKRERPLESIREEEKPYFIPNQWAWIRLSDAIEGMANGIYKSGVFYSDDGIACLRMYNINSGKINFQNLKRMILNDQEMEQYLLKQGDLLVNRVNSRELVGKSAVIPELKEPVIFESKNIRVRFDTRIILPDFVNILFQTKEVWQVWQGTAKQTCGQASVSQPQIAGICTPLPPLAEQHRIVAKVDRLMALCDELEARQQQERAGCLKLGTASFAGLQNAESPEEFGRQWAQVCDAFDLILDCPENVAMLRQTILQLAVQGRLVRQDSGDEPAEKLVERIREKKERLVKNRRIKKEKPLESIKEEEKPYFIPNQWAWIRLGDAIDAMANGIYKSDVFYSDDGIACLRMYNISSGKINFKNLKRMVLNDQEMEQYLLKQGDLLVNRVNSRELVGKAAVIPELKEPIIFESKNIRVRFDTQIILPDFVNIFFQTKEVWQVWQGTAKQTCGQASVSQPQIAGICTPLPPLAEQHRIVAKVDALMALCDQLEAQLKERAGMQGKFTDAVVKSIGTG